ncbi:hypothetical protein ACFB49_42020 [Sphingomonas sp. DBB INV C78]
MIAIGWAGSAQATEGGASLYLLGSGGPEAAVMPPLPGVYLDNEIYVYDGAAKGGKQFVIGGNVVAGLDATIVADFPTMLWVPTTNFAGGTLAIGGAVPFGSPIIDVNAVLTGPLGGQISVNRHDSATVVGDPIGTVALGWKTGKVHIQASTIVNFPIGNYREDQLANLAFHRWVVDGSLALSWNDPEAGWDVSGKAGVTFNGKNDHTDYDSGNEFHLEGAVEKSFSKSFSAGVQGYYLKQLSGDSGAGARLGSFKGEVFGVGATMAAHGMLGRSPATVRFRFLQEFDATNRLKGASVWMGLSLPLHMVMPAVPPPAQ